MPGSFPFRPRVSIHRFSLFAGGLLLTSFNVLAQSLPIVSEAPLRAHLAFLTDDLLEGRGIGERGGALAVRYLKAQAAAIGLKYEEAER